MTLLLACLWWPIGFGVATTVACLLVGWRP